MAKISKYSLDDSVSGGDKVIGTDGATGLTKNFTVNELGAYLHDVYNVTGVISINGKDGVVTINTDEIPQGLTNLYDKEVTLTGVGATQVTGTYPNFTISSTDNNTTYDAGDGIKILAGEISNTKPDQEVTLTGYGGAIVTGDYPNFNIEVIDKDTVYTAGSGISIDANNVITNTQQDKVVNIQGSGATTVTGTYPNFTVSSTDTNTLYSAGDNIEISGTTINAIIPDVAPYQAGYGIEINQDLTITNSLPGVEYTAGNGIEISNTNVISSTVTGGGAIYTAGDGIEIDVDNTIINNAPDKTVTISGTGSASVTGTYPNFNIDVPEGEAGAITKDSFVSIGTQLQYQLSVTPTSATYTEVFISGVYQEASTYTLSGDTITLSTPPDAGDTIEIVTFGLGSSGSGINTDNFITNASDVYPSVGKVTDVVSLTQAEYDALTQVDENTFYVIVG
jgi:hypothetical protein